MKKKIAELCLPGDAWPKFKKIALFINDDGTFLLFNDFAAEKRQLNLGDISYEEALAEWHRQVKEVLEKHGP